MLTTPTAARTTNVLILCTHNSARSVLSEGMLNHWAKQLGKDVRAYSAGCAPSGRLTLEMGAGPRFRRVRRLRTATLKKHGAPRGRQKRRVGASKM